MTIVRGRRTHDHLAAGENLVVFNIGMTFNRPWRIDLWLPTLLAMPRMLAELSRETERGLVGYELLFGVRGPWIVQYWRDVDSLYAYASAPEATHRPAWAAFNRRAKRAGGAVGIWHETFPVRGAETMYVDMPALGLGKAVGTVAVTGRLEHARDRLNNRG
jgi:fumigallin biosynthesis monooxygenase-like protein